MKAFPLLLIGLVIQIFYICNLLKNNTKKAVVCKVISCSTFVITAFIFGNSNIIAFAILLGYIGDVLLGVRRLVKCHKVLFAVGTVFFMAEHFVLIFTMLPQMKESILLCLLTEAIAFSILYLIIKPCLKKGNGAINIIGIVYMFVLSSMVVSGVNACIINPILNTILFMIGAISFVTSDTILVHSNFGANDPWMHPTSLVLYFIAQSLITLSIVFKS